MPSNISATVGGTRPSPHSSTPSNSTPSVGSARSALTPVTTRNVPRPVCPISIPIGTATYTDTTTATPVYCRCSAILAASPAGPPQLAAVKMYDRACCRKFMPPPSLSTRRHEDRDDARDDLVALVGLVALGEPGAQTADADHRTDRNHRDVGDGDNAQAGDEHRNRQRQFDFQHAYQGLVADGRGGVAHGLWHGVERLRHRPHQQRRRV